jgi:hypothetical protein
VKLPERIPKRLRDTAISFPEFGDGEGAWSRDDAIEVIESLKGTTVAVSEVIIFEAAPWGYAPSEAGLSVDRLTDEGDADYGARSRQAAAHFIRDTEPAMAGRLFALTFPLWKDAA